MSGLKLWPSLSVQTSGMLTNELNATLALPSWHTGRKLTAQSGLPSKTPPTSETSREDPGVAVAPILTSPRFCAPRVNAISDWSGDHAHS